MAKTPKKLKATATAPEPTAPTTNKAQENFEKFLVSLGKTAADVNSKVEGDSIVITWNEKARTIFFEDGSWGVGFNDRRPEVRGTYPVGEYYYVQYLKRVFLNAQKT